MLSERCTYRPHLRRKQSLRSGIAIVTIQKYSDSRSGNQLFGQEPLILFDTVVQLETNYLFT